ncbi:MAG: TIGR01777 family oxidoreductase [bacterium]|nr:TIGR01777 family oxidoreductase [bacterium]
MKKKVLITGATGLIGKRIVNELCRQGAFVRILTTDKSKVKSTFKNQFTIQAFEWMAYDNPMMLSELMTDTDIVINLAGANLAQKRWSKGFKEEVYNSRIDTTRLIEEAIKLSRQKPECLINSSAVGIYGFCGDEILTEDSSLGDDFLARLCRDWEMEAMKAIQYGVRVVTIRTGIVLDKKEGALPNFLTPFKFFGGVYQGNGKQWVSWIHLDDIVRLYLFAMENPKIMGAMNGSSPKPVTNKDFVKTIGSVLNKNLLLPVPGFALKIALGEFAENLLTGQRVFPQKAFDSGFEFNYTDLKSALKDLLKKN